MKQFPHIIAELFTKPLIITHARHAAIVKILEARLANGGPSVRGVYEDNPETGAEMVQYTVIGSTAIIPVHGVIVRHASDIPASSCGCGLDDVSDGISMAMADDAVTRLVFDFRSPGGAVTGVPEIGNRIAAITRKDTIGYTESECCSGALWLAMQCQQFYCAGSASVGSIGVWTAYADLSRQMAKEGVEIQSISAGKFKLLGAYWKPLSDEEKAMLQADVDRIYAQFKEAVKMRREVADQYMQGQIFDGQQACEIGLCDGLVDDIGELLEEAEEA